MDIAAASSCQPSENWVLLGQGKSSQVFRTGDGEVIKIFHSAVSEEMIEREMMAAELASGHRLPTAAPLARISVGEQSALVYPEVVGEGMSAAIRRRPYSATGLIRKMAELHHAIHDRPGGELRTLKSVLRTDIEYGPASSALKKAATDYLQDLAEESRLLHGDFHIDNIIVSNGRLIVLDWAKAAIGDPAADAVRSEMLMLYGDGPSDPIMNLWRAWAARRLWRAYRRCGEITEARLSMWRPVVALAWLRARPPVRARAFHSYLNRALRDARLPPYAP